MFKHFKSNEFALCTLVVLVSFPEVFQNANVLLCAVPFISGTLVHNINKGMLTYIQKLYGKLPEMSLPEYCKK